MIGYFIIGTGILAFAVCLVFAIAPAVRSAQISRELGE